jgi:hypothetical protein
VIVAFADTCAEPGPDAQQLAEGHAGHAMHARAHTHTQQHGCIAVVGHTRLRARAAAAAALRGAAQHACTRARRRGWRPRRLRGRCHRRCRHRTARRAGRTRPACAC